MRAGAWLLAAFAGAALLFEVTATSASEPDAVTCRDDGTTCLVDGRWTDASGNVWLPDRQVWWDGTDAYWHGQWVTGEGFLHPRYYPEAYAKPAPTGGDVQALIRQYPWPVEEALAVARCESSFRNVQNGSGGPYFGPFQMWSGHFRPGEDMWNVADNVAVAFRVWSGSGWGPWGCKPY